VKKYVSSQQHIIRAAPKQTLHSIASLEEGTLLPEVEQDIEAVKRCTCRCLHWVKCLAIITTLLLLAAGAYIICDKLYLFEKDVEHVLKEAVHEVSEVIKAVEDPFLQEMNKTLHQADLVNELCANKDPKCILLYTGFSLDQSYGIN
jgi:hypothetical protein